MCDEIEEGELNSDLDEDLKACQKEARRISGDQQNPYDEEDEAILQLKIKALQSLLEKQPMVEETAVGTFKNQTKKKQKPEQRAKSFHGAAYFRPKPSYLKRKKKRDAARLTNSLIQQSKLPTPSTPVGTKDNYELQDMDIESTSMTMPPLINEPPIGYPLLGQPDFFNQGFFYNEPQMNLFQQQQANVYGGAFQRHFLAGSSGGLDMEQIKLQNMFYDWNRMAGPIMESAFGSHCHQQQQQQNLNQYQRNRAHSPNLMHLTLEQQQHELDKLLEAQFQQQSQPPVDYSFQHPNLRSHQQQQQQQNMKRAASGNGNRGRRVNQRNNKKFKQKRPVNMPPLMNNIEINCSNGVSAAVAATPPVRFTLSSPSTSSSASSSLTSPFTAAAKSNEKPNLMSAPFNSNGIDVDERFIDSTTTRLDIDYRQAGQLDKKPTETAGILKQTDLAIESQLVDDILTEFNSKIESIDNYEKEKLLKANLLRKLIKNKTDSAVPVAREKPAVVAAQEVVARAVVEEEEDDMAALRMNLLDTVTHKRSLRQQQQAAQQEKQMDQDMSLLKRKLIEHELMIEKQSSDALPAVPPAKFTSLVQRKINPIIIRLNLSEDDEDDDDNENQEVECERVVEEPKARPTNLVSISTSESLQNNISQFLKEAKSQAEVLALNSLLPNNLYLNQKETVEVEPVKRPSSSSSSQISELEKKSFIKSLRDKINLKTKLIAELSKKSQELKLLNAKREKDIDLAKLKIASLKEQLNAAEKIRQANEDAVLVGRQQHLIVDARLEKMQNTKRIQQQLLQKVLAHSPAMFSLAEAKKSVTASSPCLPTQPPPLPPPPPPPVVEVKAPSPPPLPPQSPPPLPPPPPPEPVTPVAPVVIIPQPESIRKQIGKLTAQMKLPPMTLGGVVAAAAISKKPLSTKTNPYSLSNVRPNLFTSKQTDQRLEHLAKRASSEQTAQPAVSVKMVKGSTLPPLKKTKIEQDQKQPTKSQDLIQQEKLNECLASLVKSGDASLLPHCESLDIWCYESVTPVPLKLVKSVDFTQPVEVAPRTIAGQSLFVSAVTSSDNVFVLDDPAVYESPLKVFRGYRFSSHFVEFNELEEAYSKLYCNGIDPRKPFCPFDMHGSCKDSHCVYQHLNVLTMDNLQRTEHFLSYCPQLLGLSSPQAAPKEALKKLKAYAKQFMNTHLNKMSIKDYFKHLYEHILQHLKLEPAYSTILTRVPALCLSHSKSVGIYEKSSPPKPSGLDELLDTMVEANMNRSLDVKLKYWQALNRLDIEWLKTVAEHEGLTGNELVVAWLYHGRHLYQQAADSVDTATQKLLNVLSHALEAQPRSELVWLAYLRSYLSQKNAFADYHEVCMLCMDNLVTYDLVWLMLSTCRDQYLNCLLDLYEKCLLGLSNQAALNEFEQAESETNNHLSKVSFYLTEMIVFNVSRRVASNEYLAGKQLLMEYLRRGELTLKLEPDDLCLLWLCAIHLEAFQCLPAMIRSNILLNGRVYKQSSRRVYWQLSPTGKRLFNRGLFTRLDSIYMSREGAEATRSRRMDSFLLPWTHPLHCSIDLLQSMFYEALKAINTRTSSTACKQTTRLISLPLFINLIALEISNKRQEVAAKLCERLLKSQDAEMLKELWVSQIFIQRAVPNSSGGLSIQAIIQAASNMFPKDPHMAFLSAQYFNSIGQPDKSIDLIESLIDTFVDNQQMKQIDADALFKSLLGLNTHPVIAEVRQSIQSDSQLLAFSVCYCYYLQLKGVASATQICDTYEQLIKKFELLSSRTIVWTRYFKYVSSAGHEWPDRDAQVFGLIKKCVHDLDKAELSTSSSTELIIPFFYLSNTRPTTPGNQPCGGSNFFKEGLYESRYYRGKADSKEAAVDDVDMQHEPDSTRDYYYHNCLVDLWFKLYTRTPTEKHALAKLLVELMPHNMQLLKIYLSSCVKLQGAKAALQAVYDHLTLHSCVNEALWILCIKLCMDMNDLPQAVLVYRKATDMCTRHNSSMCSLGQLAACLQLSNEDNESSRQPVITFKH